MRRRVWLQAMANMHRRYFGAVNPRGQISLIDGWPDLRHCFATADVRSRPSLCWQWTKLSA